MGIRYCWLVLSLCLPSGAAAQQPPATPGTSRVVQVTPLRSGLTPPPISLQRALEIAERYIAESKIPIERYWLRRAEILFRTSEIPGIPWSGAVWFFDWDNLGLVRGDYILIEVDMTGRVVQRPSM